MFLLFQKRDFSALVSDTFTFLRVEGKNYFKHFLKLCGIPLFIILILIYLLADIGVSSAVSTNTYASLDPNKIFENIFDEHLGIALLALAGLLLVALVLSVICYAYPALYMKNLATNNGIGDQSKIGKQITQQIGRILLFFLGTTFLIFPLIILTFYIAILLVFLIIGLPILLLMIPTVYSMLTLACYEYLTKGVGFFTAYGNAIRYLRYNYWSIIGNTFIFYIITSMITVLPSILIQVMVLSGSLLIDDTNLDSPFFSNVVKLGIVLLYFVYILFGILAQNVMFINQGIIYYSEREKKENIFTKNKIDSIGSTNE